MGLEKQEILYLWMGGNRMLRTIIGTVIGFIIGMTYGLWQYATPDSSVVKVLSYIKGILEAIG
jgi:hypothetical protein